MRIATRNKLNEILKLIELGSTEKEIIKTKFARNSKQMKEWIQKIFPELTLEEKKILSFEEKKITIQPDINLPLKINIEAFELLQKHEKRFQEYEKRLQELEQQTNYKNKELDLLIINNEILRLKSNVRSVRVNIHLMDQFNLIADKNLKYSKTNLLNQAILEFIEKYK